MRILHLDPDDMDNPLAGGGPVRTFEICRRLARRHEITVLTPTFPGSTPERVRDGVRYVRLGRKLRNHGSSHHITFLLSLPRAVRRFEHDLLVEDFMPPFASTWTPLFHRRDTPLVASVQWFFARQYTQWLKLPFHWGEEHGVRMYRNFVVLTESMQRTITARHPRARCRVIPNGVDDSLFDLPQRAGSGILFLGRLQLQAKGIDLLLRAYAGVPEAERVPLTLAGQDMEPERLAALLDETGLRPWVRLFGPYDARQRGELLGACRFVVMPSRDETFGMTLSEANAAAKPVILWDRAPMNEVASPSSARVPAYDLGAYTQVLRDWLAAHDEALLERGRQAREYARRYDWNHIADAQEAFYLEAMEAHRTRRHLAARGGPP